MPEKRNRRGYSVVLIIGLEDMRAIFWRMYSESIKPDVIIKRGRKRENQDDKQVYAFHEEVVNALRPIIKEGVKSIILVNPVKTKYADEFLSHVSKHQNWLSQKGSTPLSIGKLEGSVTNIEEVTNFSQTPSFLATMGETNEKEASRIVDELEERLGKLEDKTNLLLTVKEIEGLLDEKTWMKIKPVYIVLTDEYMEKNTQKQRINRILQLAKNKQVKTRIITADTDSGARIEQFGGMICITEKL
jgi:stalled ribosome rescue protein Dom34